MADRKESLENLPSTESPISTGCEGKGNPVATEQPNITPTADATDTTAMAISFDGASESPITAKPCLEAVIELRVHRPYAMQEDLDEEAVVLMQTIRECVLNCQTLTGLLGAGREGVARQFQPEIRQLDATASFLLRILSPSAHARDTPTREQVLLRADIQKSYAEAIRRSRRLFGGDVEWV